MRQRARISSHLFLSQPVDTFQPFRPLIICCSIWILDQRFQKPNTQPRQPDNPTSSLSSIPSPDSGPVDSAQPSTFPNETGITCAWLGCQKVFSTVSDYNHHCKSHTRPHQCSACCARFANKRHLNRYVNECHTHAEKYYCPVATCKRSKASGRMLPFLREDNCQKHMKTHRLRGLQLIWCDMDESTKNVRLKRKIERQAGF